MDCVPADDLLSPASPEIGGGPIVKVTSVEDSKGFPTWDYIKQFVDKVLGPEKKEDTLVGPVHTRKDDLE